VENLCGACAILLIMRRAVPLLYCPECDERDLGETGD
jgi:hypothetical protein